MVHGLIHVWQSKQKSSDFSLSWAEYAWSFLKVYSLLIAGMHLLGWPFNALFLGILVLMIYENIPLMYYKIYQALTVKAKNKHCPVKEVSIF